MARRSAPLASRIAPISRRRRPRRSSRSSIWSRACTAVVGSFTAGESALIAMSTTRRMAYFGSCSKVRSAPSRTAARSFASLIARPPRTQQDRRAFDQGVAHRGPHFDQRAGRRREVEQRRDVERLQRARPAGVAQGLRDRLVGERGRIRRARRRVDQRIRLLDHAPAVVGGEGEHAVDLQQRDLLDQRDEHGDAHDAAGRSPARR